MCGVIGFSSKEYLTPEDKLLLKLLMMVDVERGRDSTGVAILVRDEDKKVVIFNKDAIDGFQFVTEGKTDFIDKKDFSIGIAHNRQASYGSVNKRNAHPFILQTKKGYDFGCHNGTFSNDIHTFLEAKKFDVDSEIVLQKLATDKDTSGSIEKAIYHNFHKIVANSKGSFSILYVDTNSEKLYAFREPSKPLWAFQTDKMCWITSTKEIFKKAYFYLYVSLSGKIPNYKNVIIKETCLEPYNIYSVHRGEINCIGEIISKEELNEIKEKEEKKYLFKSFNWQKRLFNDGEKEEKEIDIEEEYEYEDEFEEFLKEVEGSDKKRLKDNQKDERKVKIFNRPLVIP